MTINAELAQYVISINPFNNQPIGHYPRFDLMQLDALLQAMSRAQTHWQTSTLAQRADLLLSLARTLRLRQHQLAALATTEMGKTLASAMAEVEKCASVCDYYAAHGPAMLREDVVLSDDGVERFVSYQPLGTVLAIMPWNFP